MVTYEGKTASQLNAADADTCDRFCFTEPGHRKTIYSDATGKLRRLTRSRHTGRPIVEELDEVYGYFGTVAFPSEAWAAARGLG